LGRNAAWRGWRLHAKADLALRQTADADERDRPVAIPPDAVGAGLERRVARFCACSKLKEDR
jgi:hypothetical protein